MELKTVTGSKVQIEEKNNYGDLMIDVHLVSTAAGELEDMVFPRINIKNQGGKEYRGLQLNKKHNGQQIFTAFEGEDLVTLTEFCKALLARNEEQRAHRVEIYLGSDMGDSNYYWHGDDRTPIEDIIKQSIEIIQDVYKPEFVEQNAREAVEQWDQNRKAKTEAKAKGEAIEMEAMQKKEESKKGISCKVIHREKGSGGEEGVDPSALVEIIIDGGSPLRFNCRNVFDFGYVVNPDYPIMPGMKKGGLYSQGKWQTFDADKGWYDVREATSEEKRAMTYLYLDPPIYDGIRM